MNVRSICLLGGDLRQAYLASQLAADGCSVKIHALDPPDFLFPETVIFANDLETALNQVDLCILGLPVTRDGKNLWAPTTQSPISLAAIAETIDAQTDLCGGLISSGVAKVFPDRVLFDYAAAPAFARRNAHLTAEGALFYLIRALPKTLSESHIAVTGYGAVARSLTRLLLRCGCSVSVFARKTEAQKTADSDGARGYDLTTIPILIDRFDALINTVPAPIIDPCLPIAYPKLYCLELASSPGGFGPESPAENAPGIPGKFSPESAAAVIRDILYDHWKEGFYE